MLQMPRKKQRLGTSANARTHQKAIRKNQVRAWGFIFDRRADGTSLKWPSVADVQAQERLALKMARRMTS